MAENKTHCRNHCATCGRHFTSTRAFDFHRTGPLSERTCIDPVRDDRERFTAHDGVCDLVRPEEAEPEPGTVWSVR